MNTTGYIKNGRYYAGEPGSSFFVDSRTAVDKVHEQDSQRMEHRRELIQPYVNGRPNAEFIREYPAEAKNYGFIKE